MLIPTDKPTAMITNNAVATASTSFTAMNKAAAPTSAARHTPTALSNHERGSLPAMNLPYLACRVDQTALEAAEQAAADEPALIPGE